MKKFLIIFAVALFSVPGNAQTDPLYTQYRVNMMSVNPAYAGSRNALTVGYLYRNQWVGLDGAPTTQTILAHSPINNNLGFGASVTHDVIGPTKQTSVFANASGRVKFGNGTYLAAGLQFGVDYFNSNFTSITTGTGSDNAFAQNTTLVLPNVGAGIYLYNSKYYLGFSIPKVLSSVLYDNGAGGDVTQKRHYIAIAGYVFDLRKSIAFKPSVLTRFVEGAPASLDITTQFIFAEQFWIGPFYRWAESTGIIVGYNVTPQLRIGYSYDYSLTELVDYNSGSHELTLTYDFIYSSGKKLKSPRYF